MRQVTISLPATSANLGPGYDCLGLALDLRHRVTLTPKQEAGLRITAAGEDAQRIPRDESNLVYRSMRLLFERVGHEETGLHIHQENEIPIASGLGSSSSAVLAGLFGANVLAGSPLSKVQILQLATDIEGHPDNVAPAVFGGLVLGVQNTQGLIIQKFDLPTLQVMVVLPEFELLTEAARAALPQKVSLSDAIFNSSHLALLIQALSSADYDQLAAAMDDRLHQPYRIPMITGMEEAMQAARKAGAAGVALSGAGPSLIAFAEQGHEVIGTAVVASFRDSGLGARRWLLDVDRKGLLIHSSS